MLIPVGAHYPCRTVAMNVQVKVVGGRLFLGGLEFSLLPCFSNDKEQDSLCSQAENVIAGGYWKDFMARENANCLSTN